MINTNLGWEVELYHTTEGEKITEIHEDGTFGSWLFFSDEIYSTENTYSIDTDELNHIDAYDFWYEHTPEQAESVVCDVMKLFKCDFETACDWLDGTISYENYSQEELYNMSLEEKMSIGDRSWALQKLQAECGEALGYDVVGVSDEHGTSYMINMKNRFHMLKLIED